MRTKDALRCVLMCGGAAAAMMWSAPALAQGAPAPAPAANSGSVEEVVVTARRREEVLQNVPISVSTYSAAKLDNMGVKNITFLNQTAPNTTVQVARGTNSTIIAFMRGVGQQDPLWGFEPGVGLYVDDVYYARPQAAVLDIYDIQRVEVLRGPQGTLYGRNTIGGAIKYVTAPIGSTPLLTLRGEIGTYNERNFIASASTPLGDYWSGGVAIARYSHDGWGTNITTGQDQYNKDETAARGTLEFHPTGNLSFRLSGDWVKDNSNYNSGHREKPTLTLLGAPVAGGGVLPGVYDTAGGLTGPPNRVETRGVSLVTQYTVNDQLSLKSITAYRDGHTDTLIDFDDEPAAILDVVGHYNDHQFTQEFQATFTGERLQGTLGAFYLNSMSAGVFDTILGYAGLSIGTAGSVTTKSYSLYGNFSYDLTDRLAVEVGGRWTRDEKTGAVFRAYYLGATPSPLTYGTPRPILQTRTNYINDATFSQFTPRFSLSYKLSPELTTYASYSQGFKSGGFDMRGDAVLYPNTVNPYQPETVNSIEAGLKGHAFDNRVTFASAIFYSKYKDQQITTQYPATAGVASVVDNVGSSTIYGAEFDGSVRVTDEVSFNGDIGYVHAKYDNFLAFVPGASGGSCAPNPPTPPSGAGCFVDVSAARAFQNTPKITGAVSMTFNHHMENGSSIVFIPMASYRSHMQMFEAASSLDQPAYWLYNASLSWISSDSHYKLTLAGLNLANEHYRVGGYNFPFTAPASLFGNSVSAYYGPPRTVTLSLTAKF